MLALIHQMTAHVHKGGYVVDERRADLDTGAAGGASPQFVGADHVAVQGATVVPQVIIQFDHHVARREDLRAGIRRADILTTPAAGAGFKVQAVVSR